MKGRRGDGNRRWVRRFSVFFIGLAVVLALALAVPAMVDPGVFAPPLVVWHFLPADGPFAGLFSELAAAWEASGGGRPVRFVAVAGDLPGAMAATRPGRRPDVVLATHTALPTLIAAGWARPVPPPGPEVLVPAALAVREGAADYAIPFLVEGPALIYDPDVLERPPATLGELEALLRRGGGLFDLGDPYLSLPFLAAFGARLAEPAGLEDLGTAAVERWLAWLGGLGGALPSDRSYAAAMEAWAEGDSALMVNGPWALDDLLALGRPFAVAPLPRGPEGPARPLADVQVAVVTAPRRGSDALAFARLLAEPDRQAAWAAKLRFLPADARAFQLPQLAGDPVVRGFYAALREADPLPGGEALGAAWFWLVDALHQVLDGGVAPESAARELIQRLTQVLASGEPR